MNKPFQCLRDEFLFPPDNQGQSVIYLAGNSLGLQPKKARQYIVEELEDWERWGVEGHLNARHPWLPYHEFVTEPMARVVGALPSEVVVMNTLSVNLHLMMVSFYRPTSERYRIAIEAGAFPSDQYAVASQTRFHGLPPEKAVAELKPRVGENCIRTADIVEFLEREGKTIALLLLGNVNYLTGQAFDMEVVTRAAQAQGCVVGWDLAHGAGNLELRLHDIGADFAVWCGYKYLNGGPGTLAGCFVHERHARAFDLPRFAGWWGHNKDTRFQMGPTFDPLPGAEGWQLSNPPIFQLAALRASLELFDRATMPVLRRQSMALTAQLETGLATLPPGHCEIITPTDPAQRGTQLSLRIKNGRELSRRLAEKGVFCDFREPDVVRVAPVPLYTRPEDVARFVELLDGMARGKK